MSHSWQLAHLALAWAAWCGLHSLLLWAPLRGRVQSRLGLRPSQYRIFFSLLALLSLAPVGWLAARAANGGFFWPFPLLWLQGAAWLAAGALFWWAQHSFASHGVDLLGLSEARLPADRAPSLVSSGAYAHTRHPMNWALMLLLWVRPLDAAAWVGSLVITAYVLLATLHEESRLAAQFGERWREYAARVPRYTWRLASGRSGD